MDRKYYLASGNDERIVKDFFERRLAAMERAREIAEKHGGRAVNNSAYMVGVIFDGKAPDGWVAKGSLADGGKYYVPARRSKVGRAASDEIRSLRIPGASDLHSQFSDDGGVFGDAGGRGGFAIYYITAEMVAGRCIIQVPAEMDFVPAESVLLKQSEYWQIKEQKDAA